MCIERVVLLAIYFCIYKAVEKVESAIRGNNNCRLADLENMTGKNYILPYSQQIFFCNL